MIKDLFEMTNIIKFQKNKYHIRKSKSYQPNGKLPPINQTSRKAISLTTILKHSGMQRTMQKRHNPLQGLRYTLDVSIRLP